MPGFQYVPRSQEAWDKRASGKLFEGYALDKYKTLTLKDENTIRILPPTWEDPKHYGIDIWIHFGVGPMNAAVLCLHRMRGEKCPRCEGWARAEEQGRPDAKDLKPTRRVLTWNIDRSPGEDKIPVLWAMPQTVDTSIASICLDRMSGELFQIDNPEAGYDVYFQRKQKGGGAMYVEYVGFQLARRPTAIDPKFLDYICDNPLPTTLNWRSYEEIERLDIGGADKGVEERPQFASAPPAAFEPPPFQAVQAPPTQTHTAPPAPPATVHMPPPPPVQVAPPPPPPPQPFKSEWTGTHCSVCGKGQFTTETSITCEMGHVGAISIEEQGNGAQTPPPTQPAQATPVVSRAQALKARFNTGK